MGERVLVTGGRDYQDRATVYRVLDELHASRCIECLIEGGATGADTLAREWAKAHLAPENRIREDANWKKHGRAAGPIRNAEMLRHNPSLVIAFPGGKGTADMVAKARRAKVEVWTVAVPARSAVPQESGLEAEASRLAPQRNET
jgi:predicted polyphosphate/ATP-dependent NAD kinase